ncbi:anthranilate synthase component I [Candidatus Daviesbacteria bacterium RIFCSPLOWO2_01_FULL_38_10]|uniref:Anthranilate/para-aminobenzoate synthase component 1 n=1 Tax=Candidatus Daviesbacteria bacterium GW2011_GWF2_38_6 TaxID=1618432 RepID=A0A0G0NJL4_9BACT|nr:MAG: Anthranilate/para-aminobenzoate synthase component 1 [Candidatus Daviesbacteria bacterium GW2011_GWF2_38_6]OGE26946.1 MAG: anthranilate synthase component I [Candidatus Daviesbacteria bacterium RIFCSPHIGHO2_02_FULL_39_41]OGE29118.1 MAG: anthranilate synthase component I [Candidatus Daviesbacteria bacterium RIFCSPHIGHO2_01_FULL_38_8b]OGE40386.1 MAG: anthranilate synthase component I [Candidatus Daviesbacteria bacterium RIFCSPLOWO2_01_FULL_38_10]OGE44533.1 MAG: anthranilate synthase compo
MIKIPQKPVYIKFAQDIDFFKLFQKIEQQFSTCFIFESLGEEGKFSRYSIIGFDPEYIISARGNNLIINKKNYSVDNPYLELRKIMPQNIISKNYAGGLVGYLSYDAVNYFEPSLNVKVHDLFDQFMFGAYTDGVIFDKLTNELFYFYYSKDRSKILKKILKSKIKNTPIRVKYLGDELTKKEHAGNVEKVKVQIRAGNTFQCQVGFKTEYEISGNPLKIYENLRKVNPSPFMYYLKFGGKKIIGASPELLFSLRDKEMITRPLAGTIQRGKNELEDQKLARALLSDPKERAEHNMLVDLHRNDLGRSAQFGTVRVKDLMSVKKFKFVQHISSEITGIIKPDEDMFSALSYNFPAGTVSGAPKIESIRIIDNLERTARGPYGGAVGHFGFDGDCTFAIAIRSLFIAGSYGYSQTSGGIVYDSVPKKEYDEIQRKLAAMRKVLAI